MEKKKKEFRDKIVNALGASRAFHISDRKFGSPLGWIEQAKLLQKRLISRGGRPSDPSWEIKRLVPFKRENWETLTHLSGLMSTDERKIGPAQLSALLIERQLNAYATGNALANVTIHVQGQPSQGYLYSNQSFGSGPINVDIKMPAPQQKPPASSNKAPGFSLRVSTNEFLLVSNCQ